MTFVNDRHHVGSTHLLGSPGCGEAQTPASEPWLGCPGERRVQHVGLYTHSSYDSVPMTRAS